MTNTAEIKKDLQKIVKEYRATCQGIEIYGKMYPAEYPKAMMTGQQIEKRTATINFGYNREQHQNEYAEFLTSESFKAFCEKHNIKVGPKEINSDNRIQLRMYY